jgi:hypothetical protein
MGEEQLKVLQMIADGIISAEEGERLLQVLEVASGVEPEVDLEFSPNPEARIDQVAPKPVSLPPKPDWSKFWFYPTVIGGALILLGLGYTVLAVGGPISGWWLLLTLPSLVLGTVSFLLGWLIRSSCWLHVRIKDEQTNFKICLPLPLSWIAWGIKIARPFAPKLTEVVTDDLLETLAKTSSEGIFRVEVEEATGEYVQIYYG